MLTYLICYMVGVTVGLLIGALASMAGRADAAIEDRPVRVTFRTAMENRLDAYADMARAGLTLPDDDALQLIDYCRRLRSRNAELVAEKLVREVAAEREKVPA